MNGGVILTIQDITIHTGVTMIHIGDIMATMDIIVHIATHIIITHIIIIIGMLLFIIMVMAVDIAHPTDLMERVEQTVLAFLVVAHLLQEALPVQELSRDHQLVVQQQAEQLRCQEHKDLLLDHLHRLRPLR